jgi:hypothetical protein
MMLAKPFLQKVLQNFLDHYNRDKIAGPTFVFISEMAISHNSYILIANESYKKSVANW